VGGGAVEVWLDPASIGDTVSTPRRIATLQHALRALDRVREPMLLQFADDERLVEFQRDLLGQTALVQSQSRPDHDHASRRIIDSLAEQIFTETPLLTLDHVGQ